jgi:hypothetical protein
MDEDSIILNTIVPESLVSRRPLPLLTLARSTTESTLELIRRQQEQIQKQLSHQEYLYQNLLQYGLVDPNRGRSPVSSTLPNNLLNLINKRNRYFDGASSSEEGAKTGFGAGLASIFPMGNVFNGLGSVFEKFFDVKPWFYSLVLVLIIVILLISFCFCAYCCCCTPFGRMCCKCSLSSKKKSKKKNNGASSCEKNGMNFKSTNFGDSRNERRRCCV